MRPPLRVHTAGAGHDPPGRGYWIQNTNGGAVLLNDRSFIEDCGAYVADERERSVGADRSGLAVSCDLLQSEHALQLSEQ